MCYFPLRSNELKSSSGGGGGGGGSSFKDSKEMTKNNLRLPVRNDVQVLLGDFATGWLSGVEKYDIECSLRRLNASD